MARAKWLPLTVAGSWNPDLRRIFDRNSGAYAIRVRETGHVLYVGESHTGRGWKTLTRHFQDSSGKFADLREAFTHTRPEILDAAIWVTSKGLRTESDPDERARAKETQLIAKYKREGHELANEDAKRATVEALKVSGRTRRLASYHAKRAPVDPDTDFDFGANVAGEEPRGFDDLINPAPPLTAAQREVFDRIKAAGSDGLVLDKQTTAANALLRKGLVSRVDVETVPATKLYSDRAATHTLRGRLRFVTLSRYTAVVGNPPLPAPNVAPERRAENRTPDLFTGRTKAEEGGKARRDWKGEAERLARELATCRSAAPPIVVVEAPAPVEAPKRQEGYGETDPKGQATMFRRNPKTRTGRRAKQSAPSRFDLLWKDPRYLELQEQKDAALRALSRAEDTARVTKLPVDVSRAAAASAAASSALRNLQSYEDAFVARPSTENPGKPPKGGLVVLGELVSIVYRASTGRRRVLRWGARHAPLVAYHPPAGRLVLVFAAVAVGRSSSAGAKEYKRTHWGAEGDGERIEGEALGGPAPKLGTCLEITYATRKGGDSELVNYWHKFGDFGTFAVAKRVILPGLSAATVRGRQLVRLDGGTYRVEKHGIVG